MTPGQTVLETPELEEALQKTETKEEKKQATTYEVGREFRENGGMVLDWSKDGQPTRWLCARTKQDEILDPQGMQKECLRYLNKNGKWEGAVPNEKNKTVDEIKQWRSDWKE